MQSSIYLFFWVFLMNFWKVIKAVLAALIGVQSDKNRAEDFQAQSPLPFILVGVFLVLIFIIVLILFVNYLIASLA